MHTHTHSAALSDNVYGRLSADGDGRCQPSRCSLLAGGCCNKFTIHIYAAGSVPMLHRAASGVYLKFIESLERARHADGRTDGRACVKDDRGAA